MRTPPRREVPHAGLLAAVAAAVTVVLVAAGSQRGESRTQPTTAVRWAGLAGDARPKVAVGQRMIVVLKAPSLSDRVARAGGLVSNEQERRWTETVLSEQKLLLARLVAEGVQIVPEYSYARTINGFAAPVDARSLALLERAPQVAGVYPVRAAYPATSSAISRAPLERAHVSLPGFDGRGVTVALLDTGVDRAHPFLRGRIVDAADIVGHDALALAAADPDDPGQLERHGTEIAGLLVGAGGPNALAGIAPGASVYPVRVAGWQRDATGSWAVYGRTDQLIAGLERAVDPNGDGDAHDAARVALVGLAEPFAGFADGPAAEAIAGASRLDTLVVAPAGNDGPAGPSFGSIAGPGGAPDALTVGAADLRRDHRSVRVVVQAGLDVLLDRRLPLVGTSAPGRALHLRLTTGRGGNAVARFFDRRGYSLVAGHAALAGAGNDPAAAVDSAATAGARAVLLFGGVLPPGSLGLAPTSDVPVVGLPRTTARQILQRLHAGERVGVSIAGARSAPNTELGRVAAFSSQGLAFDGRVKPDLVAPGVALATAEPGVTERDITRYGTVNGSSAAAAVVAGAAALVAEARPALDAAALKSVLVGTARPVNGDGVTAAGAGMLDVGAATAAEVGAEPATLAFGRAHARWHAVQHIRVRNLSTRPMNVFVSVHQEVEGAAAVGFAVHPRRVSIPVGADVDVTVRTHVESAPQGTAAAAGVVVLNPAGSGRVHVPWVISFAPPARNLIGQPHLSERSFAPSDAAPALLTFDAGAVEERGGQTQVQPLVELQVRLYSSNGSLIGLLARLRDLLPGRYQLGLTGRDPAGAVLPRGDYVIRLVGRPTLGGPLSQRSIRVTIK